MAFKKGEKRPGKGGRKKGATNKKVTKAKLRDQMVDAGLSIAEEFKAVLHDPGASAEFKLRALQWITEWTQTKPKETSDSESLANALSALTSEADLDEAENNVVRFGASRM